MMMTVIMTSRRNLIKSASALGSLLVVSPVIVRASSLMDIDSPDNNIVIAYDWGGDKRLSIANFLPGNDFISKIKKVQDIHYYNEYSFERRGNVYNYDYTTPEHVACYLDTYSQLV